MGHRSKHRGRIALGVLALAASQPNWAQLAPSAQPASAAIDEEISARESRLRELRSELISQERQMEETRRQLTAERRRIETLLGTLSGRGNEPPGPVAQAQSAPAPGAPPDKPVGQAPTQESQRPPQVAQIFQSSGVLTPRGRFVFEPSLQYAHATDNRVAIVGYSVIPAITIGLIDVRRVSRDIWTAALTGRYGLDSRTEIEARIPYVYRNDKTITRPIGTPSVTDETFDASARHLGDVEMTIRRQLNDGGADKPYFVGSLRIKSRTGEGPFDVELDPTTRLQRQLPSGSGFWAVAPGFTMLLPSDPVVFFGGTSYMHSFARDVGNGFGRIKPGAIFNVNFGMGLALNDKATFSIGYDHSVVRPSRQADLGNATNTIGTSTTSQLGTLIFGLAYRLSPNRNLNFALGVGATRESPDVQFTVRIPTTF